MTESGLRKTPGRRLSDYGMLIVLLLLCVFLSIVTWAEQHPNGAKAGRELARDILAAKGKDVRVLIAVRTKRKPGQEDPDAELAGELEKALTAGGAVVIKTVHGKPSDARAILNEIDGTRRELSVAAAKLIIGPQGALASCGAGIGGIMSAVSSVALDAFNESRYGRTLDVIAGNSVTGNWLVFKNMAAPENFPKLAKTVVMMPKSYWWPNFLKPGNLVNVTDQIVVIAILAIGVTMVIITGGIDLSVGSLIALSAVTTALLIRDIGGGRDASALMLLVCAFGGIALCALVGLFSGTMVTVFKIPPFIATLAILLVGSGLAYIFSDGEPISNSIPPSFRWLGGEASLLGIPNAVVMAAILYVVAHIVMSRTKWGRYIYAVGGNAEAARLSGVSVQRVKLVVYAVSGALAGLGGVVLASRMKTGSPTYGNMYELYVIAAVVVGGTSLSGGEGRVLGTLIGALIIAVIRNGMNLTNVEAYKQKVILGLVILGAVLLDTMKKKGWAGKVKGLFGGRSAADDESAADGDGPDAGTTSA